MSFIKFFFGVCMMTLTLFGGHFILEEFLLDEVSGQQNSTKDLPQELQDLDNIDEIVNMDYFNKKSEMGNKDYVAILVLGVDDDNFKGSRTDSIMVAIVDKKSKKVSLLSIPRDFRVKLYNTDRYDKINSAYAYGGIDLTAATIEENFGIPIHYYSMINFKGFQDLVDSLGGVDMYVEKDISFPDRITNTQFELEEGRQTLSGIEALNYARFRGDSEGDFGRMRRQQQVMGAIMDETISFRSIPKLTKIYDSIDNNYESNINFTDLTLLALKFRNLDSGDLQMVPFKTEPTSRGGVSYVEASDDEMDKIEENLERLMVGKDLMVDKDNNSN